MPELTLAEWALALSAGALSFLALLPAVLLPARPADVTE